MKTILITGVGSAGAQNIVKAFRKSEEETRFIGIDCDAINAGKFLVDKFIPGPSAKDPKFYEKITSILEESKPDLLIPVAPPELPILALYKNELEKKTKVLISDYETINLFSSKKRTLDFFIKIGVPNEGYYRRLSEIKFPAFAKLDGSSGSFDSMKIMDKEDLDYYLKKFPESIIMPFIRGTEYSVDCFCDKDGDLVGFVPRRRIQVKAGVATKGITEEINNLENHLKKITKSIELIGPFNLQLFVKEDGSLSFFEINPRIGGSFIHSIEAGLDIAQYIIDFINDKKSKPLTSFKKRLIMVRSWQEHYEEA
ncbi:ATP-grasp domain-containing protein [Candidatus Micrarchaeota archaeon]|nr:ATP-grasp domain-containing protein [Candidatus Micrarchaeota archaeon]